MMAVGNISSDYVEYLLKHASNRGLVVSRILRDLNIEMDNCRPEGLSATSYSQLYQRLMLEMQDEWFGLFSGGASVPLGAFRMLCMSLIQCTNLRQALIRSGEFAEICRGLKVRVLVEEDDTLARLTFGPIRSVTAQEFQYLQSNTDPNFILASLYAGHRFHCWLVGKELAVEQVSVSFCKGDTLLPLNNFRGAEVLENTGVNQLVYASDILDLPIVQNLQSFTSFIQSAPFHLVTEEAADVSIKERVRNILNRDVGHTMPCAEEVAKLLNISVTTLRRRLILESSSYQTIKDECRLEAALYYLSCPNLTNTMVAERLGFNEPSAFFRVFKKWTGETPGNYRQRFLNDSLNSPPSTLLGSTERILSPIER